MPSRSRRRTSWASASISTAELAIGHGWHHQAVRRHKHASVRADFEHPEPYRSVGVARHTFETSGARGRWRWRWPRQRLFLVDALERRRLSIRSLRVAARTPSRRSIASRTASNSVASAPSPARANARTLQRSGRRGRRCLCVPNTPFIGQQGRHQVVVAKVAKGHPPISGIAVLLVLAVERIASRYSTPTRSSGRVRPFKLFAVVDGIAMTWLYMFGSSVSSLRLGVEGEACASSRRAACAARAPSGRPGRAAGATSEVRDRTRPSPYSVRQPLGL